MNQENLKLVQQLRKKLHTYPELSGHEEKTKKILLDFIRNYTTFEIVEQEKWFYVVYEEGASETIGFRADMDAVFAPNGEVKHACGHDGHSATLAGLILEVFEVSKKQKLGKNICFIFQYGEETGEGGSVCSQAIEWNKISEIYAYHNIPEFITNTVLIRRGTFACTSKGISIQITGTPTHAAYPEYGRNPSITIGKLLSELPKIINPKDYKGMVLCTVIGVHVGNRAFGVAASEGEVLLTIRGEYEEDMRKMQEKLQNRVLKETKTTNLTVNIEYCDEFPETRNDENIINKIEERCKQKNYAYIEIKEPFRWSEDFGHYLKKCKGAMIGIGSGEEHAQLHTADYEYPDEIIERAVDVFFAQI